MCVEIKVAKVPSERAPIKLDIHLTNMKFCLGRVFDPDVDVTYPNTHRRPKWLVYDYDSVVATVLRIASDHIPRHAVLKTVMFPVEFSALCWSATGLMQIQYHLDGQLHNISLGQAATTTGVEWSS